MKCVVTGAAGFIGSHLCEHLLRAGHEVTGLDAFIPYYPRQIKERNQAQLLSNPRYHFHGLDLRRDPLEPVIADAEVIFHLAAMPGLVQSWKDFHSYWTCNVEATHCLLEAIRKSPGRLHRLVYASTSSVYGRFSSGDELMPTRPISPYGVTKLAAEHLCQACRDAYDVPLVVLLFFPSTGRDTPGHGLFSLHPSPSRGAAADRIRRWTPGRGNTYVADCVEATIAAVEAHPGEIYNIGGGEAATVWDILRRLEELAGRRAVVQQEPARAGDRTIPSPIRARSKATWAGNRAPAWGRASAASGSGSGKNFFPLRLLGPNNVRLSLSETRGPASRRKII